MQHVLANPEYSVTDKQKQNQQFNETTFYFFNFTLANNTVIAQLISVFH